ncbi:MAG: hypothetical protein ACOY5F_22100 [Pseudomonadota bacterium]
MARPTSDKNASRHGRSAPAVAPAQRTGPGAKGKFAKSPKLYDPIPPSLPEAKIALSPAEAVRILRTMKERVTAILGSAWPSLGTQDGHRLLDELEGTLTSAIDVAFHVEAKLLGEGRREAQQITRQIGESIFRSVDLLSSRSRNGDQFKRIWDNGITLIGAITGDEPRGRLQPKETTAPETSELEARVLALAGELRTVSKPERKRLLSLLGQELGLSATFAEAADETGVVHFPEKAPELWADRPKDSRESPADFILRVYQPWLGSGFARPDLRALDIPLYQAFAKWIARHPVPKTLVKFCKETRAARIERELKELNIREPADAYRKLPNDKKRADRLFQAALHRKRASLT